MFCFSYPLGLLSSLCFPYIMLQWSVLKVLLIISFLFSSSFIWYRRFDIYAGFSVSYMSNRRILWLAVSSSLLNASGLWLRRWFLPTSINYGVNRLDTVLLSPYWWYSIQGKGSLPAIEFDHHTSNICTLNAFIIPLYYHHHRYPRLSFF